MVPRPLAAARAMISRTCADVIQPLSCEQVPRAKKHIRRTKRESASKAGGSPGGSSYSP